MSEYASYSYELARRREKHLARVRETTRGFLGRYENICNELIGSGLDGYIPKELKKARADLNRLQALLETDPEAARAESIALGPSIARLPALAGEVRREIEERQRRMEEELRRAQSEMDAFLAEELRNLEDPTVRDFAFKEIRSLQAQLSRPAAGAGTAAELKKDVRQRFEAVREDAERKAADWKAQREAELRVESQAAVLGLQERHLAAAVNENSEELEKELAGIRRLQDQLKTGLSLSAQEFELKMQSSVAKTDEAVTDERCRKEAVQAVRASLEGTGFVLAGGPKRIRKEGRDEVVLLARKSGGRQVEFRITLAGDLEYDFDGYSGSACKKDIEALLPQLQEIYGIRLSRKRVLWENPRRDSNSSKPLDPPQEDARHGR